MRLRTVLVLGLCLVASACSSSLGRSVPACDERTGTLILEIQSVPGAAYVPCVASMPTGWDYEHMEADSSGATFWFDGDRLGGRFLTVELRPTCEPPATPSAAGGAQGAELFKDVRSETEVSIIVVPEGQSSVTAARAVEIVAMLQDETIEGRKIDLEVDASSVSTADRIRNAQQRRAHVMAVSIRDAEDRTVTLTLADGSAEFRMIELDDALDEIEEITGEPTYTGQWVYTFPGGCAVYTFDAAGPGVATIEDEVEAALDLFDVAPLKREARDAGFRLP